MGAVEDLPDQRIDIVLMAAAGWGGIECAIGAFLVAVWNVDVDQFLDCGRCLQIVVVRSVVAMRSVMIMRSMVVMRSVVVAFVAEFLHSGGELFVLLLGEDGVHLDLGAVELSADVCLELGILLIEGVDQAGVVTIKVVDSIDGVSDGMLNLFERIDDDACLLEVAFDLILLQIGEVGDHILDMGAIHLAVVADGRFGVGGCGFVVVAGGEEE